MVRLGVRPLIKTPVTPNHITTLRLGFGVAAAVALGLGDAFWRDIGAGLFLLSMVLDRADGELARLGGKTSPWGHVYDLYADTACNGLAFVGLGAGLGGGYFGAWALPMGAAAGAAVAVVLLLVVKLENAQGPRAAEMAGAAGFDPDDGMLAVPLLIWFGAAEILLALAAIGAPLFAVLFCIHYRRRLAGAS